MQKQVHFMRRKIVFVKV